MSMTFNEFQELSKRTMPLHMANLPHDEDMEVTIKGEVMMLSELTRSVAISNYSMGLEGEAGEVTDLLKKVYHHGHTMSREELEKEFGDVLHYLSGLAEFHGIKLGNAATRNIEKLKNRFPNGFNKEDSINRNEEEE